MLVINVMISPTSWRRHQTRDPGDGLLDSGFATLEVSPGTIRPSGALMEAASSQPPRGLGAR
jgi:hypothetical protein